jgi:hypothetical protein
VECRNLLSNVTLQANVSDSWQWLPVAGGYTLRTSYQMLTTQVTPTLDDSEDLI